MRDTESNPFLESAKSNFALEEIVQYVEKKNVSQNALLMGFYDRKTEKHIGNVKLEPIAIDSSHAWFGVSLINLVRDARLEPLWLDLLTGSV